MGPSSAGGPRRWPSSSAATLPIRKTQSVIWAWSRVSPRNPMCPAIDRDPISLDPSAAPARDRGSASTIVPIRQRGDSSSLFRSFWIGGFESACHINRSGVRIDMVSATQHDELVEEDYLRLVDRGIHTVREGARWHLIETPRGFDYSSLRPTIEAARRHRIQVIWSLCHYGWPDDLDILDSGFIGRFSRYCRNVARFIADHSDGIQFYTPVNEISFLAWAA